MLYLLHESRDLMIPVLRVLDHDDRNSSECGAGKHAMILSTLKTKEVRGLEPSSTQRLGVTT